MNSLEGKLLVAAPQMRDPRFERSVILMMHHDDAGAFGVVLNRRIDETVAGLWEKLGETACGIDCQLNMGGPVSGPIIAIHGLPSAAEFEVPPGVFVAEQKRHIRELVHHPDVPLRVYVGHVGWEPGQLENEIVAGHWLTLPAKAEHVFNNDEDLWVTATRQIGQQFWRTSLNIQSFPPDVSVN